MATSKVMLYSAFDPTSLRFGAVERNRKGGKIINVYTESTNGPINVQSCACHIPFGVSKYTDATGEVQSYNLDLSFRGADTDPKVALFQERMAALDDVILTAATENCEEWFGKKNMSRDIISELYRRVTAHAMLCLPRPMSRHVLIHVLGLQASGQASHRPQQMGAHTQDQDRDEQRRACSARVRRQQAARYSGRRAEGGCRTCDLPSGLRLVCGR